jgi:hypothetical protein
MGRYRGRKESEQKMIPNTKEEAIKLVREKARENMMKYGS